MIAEIDPAIFLGPTVNPYTELPGSSAAPWPHSPNAIVASDGMHGDEFDEDFDDDFDEDFDDDFEDDLETDLDDDPDDDLDDDDEFDDGFDDD